MPLAPFCDYRGTEGKPTEKGKKRKNNSEETKKEKSRGETKATATYHGALYGLERQVAIFLWHWGRRKATKTNKATKKKDLDERKARKKKRTHKKNPENPNVQERTFSI